jgi:hypothetical protein
MRERGVERCQYKFMDITNMKELPDSTLDLIIDKGLYDALCADKEAETRQKCIKYLSETIRVLKD